MYNNYKIVITIYIYYKNIINFAKMSLPCMLVGVFFRQCK